MSALYVIAAAVAGLMVGAVLGLRLGRRYLLAFERKLRTNPQLLNSVSVVWAYMTVASKIREGATTDELLAFVEGETESHTGPDHPTAEITADVIRESLGGRAVHGQD